DMGLFPAMTLGANTFTPLSVANSFATLAAEGVRCTPVAIESVTTRDGTELEVPQTNCRRAIEPDIAAGVSYALEEVVDSPQWSTGERAAIPGRDVAGKTGTANDDSAAWFAGYTPQLATAVWAGFQQGTQPMRNVTVNGTHHQRIYGGLL